MVTFPMNRLTMLFAFLAATVISQAKLITRNVAYEHEGVKLEGYLAYDDSTKGSRPGVLVIPEWWGLNDYTKGRAVELAKLGYVAFAADMYGAGKLTSDAKEAQGWAGPFYGKPLMAERARAGLDQLLACGFADPKHVAAIGYCFGGSCCLALAYSGAPLEGVVTFHGGLFSPPPGTLEKAKTKYLILHGGIDPLVKPEAVEALKKAFDEAKTDYQITIYAGAVHAFSNPEADELAAKNKMTGAIGYNEAAARRSWQQMKLFCDELFRTRRE